VVFQTSDFQIDLAIWEYSGLHHLDALLCNVRFVWIRGGGKVRHSLIEITSSMRFSVTMLIIMLKACHSLKIVEFRFRERAWCALDVIVYFFVVVCQSVSCVRQVFCYGD